MKRDGEKATAQFFEELSETKERYNRALKGELSAEYIRTDKGGAIGNHSAPIAGYNKPIYILTDRLCTSACEFTAAAFESHPTAKRVGENTEGTFHFSNAGLLG
jgi:C-terminal processing protease CtpA/Prc